MSGNSSENPKKNALSIRLTESAVFLRTDGPSGRPRRNAEMRSSLVRGLLVLELAKHTKIVSIELELVATASTLWPEGVGARRVEISEQHQAYQSSATYFRANVSTPTTRRAASIGPGTSLNSDDPALDWDEEDDSLVQSPTGENLLTPDIHSNGAISGVSGSAPSQDRLLFGSARTGRRVSVDSHLHQALPISYREEAPIPPYSPVDPSSPIPPGPRNPPSDSDDYNPHRRPTQSLEEYRAELHSSLQNQRSPSRSSSLYTQAYADRSLSRHPSMSDVPEDDGQLQPPSPSEVRPNPHPSSLSRPLTPSTPHSQSTSFSTHASGPNDIPCFPNTRKLISDLNLNSEYALPPTAFNDNIGHEVNVALPGNCYSSTSMERHGRRSHSGFSLTAVADVFREAIPIATKFRRASKERGEGRSGSILGSRDQHEMSNVDHRMRGRKMERVIDDTGPSSLAGPGEVVSPLRAPGQSFPPDCGIRKAKSRPPEPATRILDDMKIETGNGWKVFKKGTYTYPISFTIPSTAPPSLQSDYGSVVWKLHACVHRPGAFQSKYTATREVQVVTCPTEEDTEDTENIIIERHWDQQLQYLISISGRSFYIGGKVPVSFAFMPLAKVKIHRLSMFIEERVDYYTNMRRVVRSDSTTHFDLLSIKNTSKHASHILPLDSSDVNALKNLPLYILINPDEDESEVASQLMGPGPWSFHKELKLPVSCDIMHFTNKNRRANITVSHILKVVIRVERGDDLYVDKAGKRKLFDIVIQTPVHILSCRCNPEWISLPRYEEAFRGDSYVLPNCPCQVKKLMAQPATSIHPELHIGPFHAHMPAALERMKAHSSTDSNPRSTDPHQSSSSHAEPNVQAVHASETSPIDPVQMRSLRQVSAQDPQNRQMLQSSQQFERLVSGFESEFGDAPPSYNLVATRGSSMPPPSRSLA